MQTPQKKTITVTQTKSIRLPKGWHKDAQIYWLSNQKQQAIQEVLRALNDYPNGARPADLFLQIGYYLYLVGDRPAAAQFLETGYKQNENNSEILKNLAVTLTGSGQYEKALHYWQIYKKQNPNDYLAYDSLTMCYYKLGNLDQAKASGTYALTLKDQQHGVSQNPIVLPKESISKFIENKNNVISFSLWGDNPRYLRGAIDNAQARFYIYPDWKMRFYVDESVPNDLCNALVHLGCEVIYETSNQSIKEKLAWRFKVANDPSVGRFLVRDIDSVVNIREQQAVEAWIHSGQWFHIMRDWWSHTDLILAGMWGGVANVLPCIATELAKYTPLAMETPNIDQWFLRDKIWALIKPHTLIHDRFFEMGNSIYWNEDRYQLGTSWHVGQDVNAVEPAEQTKRLQNWATKIKSLKIAP